MVYLWGLRPKCLPVALVRTDQLVKLPMQELFSYRYQPAVQESCLTSRVLDFEIYGYFLTLVYPVDVNTRAPFCQFNRNLFQLISGTVYYIWQINQQTFVSGTATGSYACAHEHARTVSHTGINHASLARHCNQGNYAFDQLCSVQTGNSSRLTSLYGPLLQVLPRLGNYKWGLPRDIYV